MSDPDKLLQYLCDYRDDFNKHIQQLQDDFQGISRQYLTFSTHYEGKAAEEFKAGWEKTVMRFTDYIVYTTRLINLLDAKIDILREFAKPGI